MRDRKLEHSIPFFIFISATLAGCQTQDVKDQESNAVPVTEWATFSTLSQENHAKTFPSDIRVRTINGRALVDSRNDERVNCSNRQCKLYPGSHTIEFTYVWSQTETRGKQTAKGFGNALLAPLVFLGGGGVDPAFPIDDSHCKMTMAFDARATRGYLLNAVHIIQKEQPEEFQILDAESGSVISSAVPSCRQLFETAFPFSNKTVPDNQCAIHVLMGRDKRAEGVQFEMDRLDSHTFGARGRMAYTFFVEPGEHQIDASLIHKPAFSTKRHTATKSIQCQEGEGIYLQIDVEGFWTSRPTATELSYADAQRLISRVVAKSKLLEVDVQ
jgi:hypothetical protein